MTSSLRLVAVAAVLAMVAGACGPRDEPASTTPTTASEPADATATVADLGTRPSPAAPPAASGAVPAAPTQPDAAAAVPALPDEVEVHRPDLLVRSGPVALDLVRTARGLPGIQALAGTSHFEVELRHDGHQGAASGADTAATHPAPDTAGTDDDGDVAQDAAQDRDGRLVSVLAVDPEGFRPLTPEVTAQTRGVWERMAEGEIVVRHDVAHALGIGLGDTVELVGPSGEATVRVGAFASNGAPPLADALVPWDLGRSIGAPGVNVLVVALHEDADDEATGAAITDVLGTGTTELREAPEEREARIVGTPVRFEPFSYTDLGDGMIVIDPAWVARWIVKVELPRVGTTRVHRIMAPQLLAALREIEAEGLLEHFKPEQFGGGWVPRHIDWEPSKPLSMHAWGLAVDFNTHDNWLGQTPTMDRRIVGIFEKWGFEWGGHWNRPDGMHFELDRVVTVEE